MIKQTTHMKPETHEQLKKNSVKVFFPIPLFHLLYYLFYPFVPFSGRRHKTTHKGWRIVKPKRRQIKQESLIIF